jgi:hypothetical protein
MKITGDDFEEYTRAMLEAERDERTRIRAEEHMAIDAARIQEVLVARADEVEHLFNAVAFAKAACEATVKCAQAAGDVKELVERIKRGELAQPSPSGGKHEKLDSKPGGKSDLQQAIDKECARVEEAASGSTEKGGRSLAEYVKTEAGRELERMPADFRRSASEQKSTLSSAEGEAASAERTAGGERPRLGELESVAWSAFRGPSYA